MEDFELAAKAQEREPELSTGKDGHDALMSAEQVMFAFKRLLQDIQEVDFMGMSDIATITVGATRFANDLFGSGLVDYQSVEDVQRLADEACRGAGFSGVYAEGYVKP